MPDSISGRIQQTIPASRSDAAIAFDDAGRAESLMACWGPTAEQHAGQKSDQGRANTRLNSKQAPRTHDADAARFARQIRCGPEKAIVTGYCHVEFSFS